MVHAPKPELLARTVKLHRLRPELAKANAAREFPRRGVALPKGQNVEAPLDDFFRREPMLRQWQRAPAIDASYARLCAIYANGGEGLLAELGPVPHSLRV
eukprot:CAMPEP_0181187410 /NCGR_PEP_ID=MMETSP1096-20121128/10556_1 /TAXON_ID=156174 ORGANISM="Chrysochromulina ericina, Strain CCMP281" /NCGR_SAMPLE_ID=MMETSP1096 /ASSEMBLY_ACC=CAM_ASM_000453 /LENGTH=99 /DNA_ID=CAMNT_0023276379 /DNA_START=275 /DNA_END=575 /DNA_ORIENTATION=-